MCFGPVGPVDLPTHAEKVGDVAPTFLAGLGSDSSWWDPNIDDFRSKLKRGVDRAKTPYM